MPLPHYRTKQANIKFGREQAPVLGTFTLVLGDLWPPRVGEIIVNQSGPNTANWVRLRVLEILEHASVPTLLVEDAYYGKF